MDQIQKVLVKMVRKDLAQEYYKKVAQNILNTNYDSCTKEEFLKKVKDALYKQMEKWHFINANVDGNLIQLEFHGNEKEVYVQIFKINGMHSDTQNYKPRKQTYAMFEKVINDLKPKE